MRHLLCFLGILAFVRSASAQDHFIIEGKLLAIADSTMLCLYREEGQILQVIDTAYVVNDTFRFSYPLREDTRMAVIDCSENQGSMFLSILSKPGITVRITGENNLIYTWAIDSPVPEQQEMERYKQSCKTLWEEYQVAGIEGKKLRTKMSQATSDEEKQSIRQQEKNLSAVQDSIRYLIYEKTLSLMASSDPSEVFMEKLRGICMMIFHYGDQYGGLREQTQVQYGRLTPEQKNSEQGRQIHRHLFPPAQVKTGDEMADAELPDLSGKPHKLSDYKGKYILLDFWSWGCAPCIMAMPELKEMSEQLADRLTIIGISSDNDNIWAEATEKHGVSWVNLNAPGQSEIAVKYGVSGIPHQVIISPEGIVLDSWTGYRKGHIREKLQEYIPMAK